MRSIRLGAFASLLILPSALTAQTTVVNSGTLTGLQCMVGGAPINFGAPIAGLTFSNLRTALVPSSQCVATNSGLFTPNPSIVTVSAASGSSVQFQHVNLGGAFSQSTVSIEGVLGGNSVFTQSMFALPDGRNSTVLFRNTANVDRIVFTQTTANAPIILDNFTFAPATTVPEPSTYVLMASGLLGLYGVSVRRKRRSQA